MTADQEFALVVVKLLQCQSQTFGQLDRGNGSTRTVE
jgi:hypothetical protein